MNSYQFSHVSYQRPFRQPLHTSQGIWEVREGMIIQLMDAEGRCHQGEIAPIPWFGSESIEQAREWCQYIGDNITVDQIDRLPDTLPACQFACGSALTAFNADTAIITPPKLSALLPTGAAAIDAWQGLWSRGYTTFKWKIGVAPIAQEVPIWRRLMAALPSGAKLRLDANGGLTLPVAAQWLQICHGESKIELLEQPLAPDLIRETIELARIYDTPIALDESVATFDRLQAAYRSGWRGIYVIKPGIAGFPWRLADFITQHRLDVIFSSVLETSVGRNAAFRLAAGLKLDRAMGFGIDEWFSDSL